MATEQWKLRASKRDLEQLVAELHALDPSGAIFPRDLAPARLPRDPDSPMGQIEWYELGFALATGVAGNAIYDAAKALVQKFVAARPNQASLDVNKS